MSRARWHLGLGIIIILQACARKLTSNAFLGVFFILLVGCGSTSQNSESFDAHKIEKPQLVLVTVNPQRSSSGQSGADTRASGEGQILAARAQLVEQLHQRHGLLKVADWPLSSIDIHCIIYKIPSYERAVQVVALLAAEPGVETVQLVQTFEVQSESYNDPFLSLQHGFRSLHTALSHQWADGSGVRVAVIDTGMDTQHPELRERTEGVRNFVDQDELQFRTDVHGTAVAGIIAASANNDLGIVGMAPEANILGLKACWQTTPTGDKAICNSITLAKALDFAINQRVDVINLSLAGPPDAVLQRLVERALLDNILVVGAKPAHDEPAFPISIKGTIAVSLSAEHSSPFIAPGRKVLSTRPNNQYDFYTGSSFSTAHIAGLAALVRELNPVLSPADLLSLLDSTADTTTGAVNACKAVAVLAGHALSGCP